MKKIIKYSLFFMGQILSLQAQVFTPSAGIQGTSNSNNIGIGTSTPSASLHIRTATANFLVENSGIEGAFMTVNSGRFNRPAISSYKQIGINYWNSGILYDESGNQKYSIGTTDALSSSKFTIQSDGNIGMSTTAPSNRLQIGEFNNTQNLKICLPGVYNFEQIKLGQYGNGAGSLEIINHANVYESYGVRLYANTDSGINGLQIQTALPSNSAQSLNYLTRLAIDVNGNIGIGTITPDTKLAVNGTIHTKEVKVDLLAPMVPDYVFAKDYKLKTLQEVENYIKEYNHLPEIPSAAEFEKNGLMLAEMNMSLLQKIEELTLYLIETKKENEAMKYRQQQLENRLKTIENK